MNMIWIWENKTFRAKGLRQLYKERNKCTTIYNNKRKHDICRTLWYRNKNYTWVELLIWLLRNLWSVCVHWLWRCGLTKTKWKGSMLWCWYELQGLCWWYLESSWSSWLPWSFFFSSSSHMPGWWIWASQSGVLCC